MSRILVIKHGALGDVVLATAPFQAIRARHRQDHITLLTTAPYAELLRGSGYFDEIWIDARPGLFEVMAFFKLIRKIANAGFSRIYDLQTSGRTQWYFRLLPRPRPEWVGTARGASHRHDTPERRKLHTIERHKQQMTIAGIAPLPAPDVGWLTADISSLNLPERYAVIVPGGSAHRPGKRWPVSHYAALCSWLVRQGITPVLIGTQAEGAVLSAIESLCPGAIDLKGRTDFAQLTQIARGALCAVGNDTGPMHLVAAAGAPAFVLFSRESNPALCAPRGDKVRILQKAVLSELAPSEVTEGIQVLLHL